MIEVVSPGVLTSVQTASGRLGWRHLGVPVGGAADPWSARLANRLVGNDDDAALLEVTIHGPQLAIASATTLAVTGASFDVTLDGIPLAGGVARGARAGSLLSVGSGDGARCYVALGGGLEVEPVLGSRATDLRTGFGGHRGRALRAGDHIRIGTSTGVLRRGRLGLETGPIRVLRGPHASLDPDDALLGEEWTAGTEADRAGVRLDGTRVRATRAEIESIPLALGAIQVPPDGRPIVMLADRPVTGGYAVPACVIDADIGRVAALRPGDRVRFRSVPRDEAREARVALERDLGSVEDLASVAGDELGWAGAIG